MENSWNSSRRIFLHVACDVASSFLSSEALLYCYLCPASSPFPGRDDVWEKQRNSFHPWGAPGLCGIRRPGALCRGEGTNHTESRESARGKGKPGCHRDSGRGRTVQQDLVLGLSPALVKIIVVLSLIIKILRSGLELDCYCSFSALPSATSV